MNTRRHILIALLLAILCIAVFSRVAHFEFINYDDNAYIAENPAVRDGFSRADIVWAFTAIDYFYWQPLTWLSHMADCQIFGLSPGWHHLVNLLFHIANSILVFLAFRRMTGAFWRSAILAALFAIHPLRVESVAWIAERKDVLSTFFFLAMLLAYARYAERPSRQRYWLVLGALALGLLSKPMLITTPVLLLLLDWRPLKRFAPREKLPLFVMALLCLLVTFVGVGRLSAINWGARVPLAHRVANTLVSYATYVELALWPHRLALLYPFRLSIAWWKPLAAALLLAAITGAALALVRKRPYFLVGWLWFVIALLPPSGLLQSGRQAMADRFTYIPFIGLAMMIIWGAADLLARHARLAGALAAAAIVAYGIAAWRQVAYWHDSATLFSRTVAVTGENPSAQHFLAAALDERGRFDEGFPHHAEAVRIDPTYFVAQCAYGLALESRGDLSAAVVHFRQAVLYFPRYGEAHYHLGANLARLGRGDEGAEEMRKARELGFHAPPQN
jgi:tetratricopeptide (TPR) repeat protein